MPRPNWVRVIPTAPARAQLSYISRPMWLRTPMWLISSHTKVEHCQILNFSRKFMKKVTYGHATHPPYVRYEQLVAHSKALDIPIKTHYSI